MRTKIARAKEAFSERRELLTKSMSHKIMKKMIKTLVEHCTICLRDMDFEKRIV